MLYLYLSNFEGSVFLHLLQLYLFFRQKADIILMCHMP